MHGFIPCDEIKSFLALFKLEKANSSRLIIERGRHTIPKVHNIFPIGRRVEDDPTCEIHRSTPILDFGQSNLSHVSRN